jgi:putative nucleotidyltransferase with HDIG domain
MVASNTSFPATADSASARVLRAKRSDFAKLVLSKTTRRNEWTIGSEIVALDFATVFSDALETSHWSALLGWVEHACERHPDSTSLRRLLAAGTQCARQILSDQMPAAEIPDFTAIDERIRRIASKPRGVELAGPSQTVEEIDVLLDQMIARLDRSDRMTAEHSRAVAAWCTRIALKMSLSPADAVFVGRCGLIHDIGKLSTPPHILKAPRRLDDEEMAIMRLHAQVGGEMVSAIPSLAPMTPIVQGHHERVDGRGYPDSLSSSEIVLAARIVSVADSFNAMIGTRPYRLPMPPTAALSELVRHRGTQFDPRVVDAMIGVVTTNS